MQQEIPGFKILYIYSVPPGCVINKDNFDQYPLKECGTWISNDQEWLIQGAQFGFFELVPHTIEAQHNFYNKRSQFIGTIDDIVCFLKKEFPHFAYPIPGKN